MTQLRKTCVPILLSLPVLLAGCVPNLELHGSCVSSEDCYEGERCRLPEGRCVPIKEMPHDLGQEDGGEPDAGDLGRDAEDVGCSGSEVEVCNGIDDDCDGQTDEELTPPLADVQAGVCQGAVKVCGGPAGWVEPDYASAIPGYEAVETSCDGLDNDCSGTADDVPGGCACQVGDAPRVCGSAVGECQEGQQECVNGQWGPCIGEVLPVDELCDALDNDCDGDTDEDFRSIDGAPPLRGYLFEDAQLGLGDECGRDGEWCGVGLVVCNASQLALCCTTIALDGEPACPGSPAVAELCDALDNDCDGQTDEDWPALGSACSGQGSCPDGNLICAADGLGTCCDTMPGCGGVVAAPELCNGQDDDCDGLVDEELVPEPCTAGVGVCQSSGMSTCVDGVPGCDAEPGQGGQELCDGLDNDCDGSTDEDFGVGEPCVAGVGECRREGTIICLNDQEGGCNAQVGSPTDELCDGLDNDCDESIDEDFAVGEPCSAGVGECLREGPTVCLSGSLVCGAQPGEGADELCDGLDNDCDEAVDEDFGLGMACAVGTGECRREGHIVCVEGGHSGCDVVPGEPGDELCDGLDNDCDDSTDEDVAPEACWVGLGECRVEGTTRCVEGSLVCDPDGPVPLPQDEICDGLDNDCDGAVDEDEEGLPLAQACYEGDPATRHRGLCRDGRRLCQEGGWGPCLDQVLPASETCNGQDDDCDGVADNGFSVGQPCSAGVGGCLRTGSMVCEPDGSAVRCDAEPGIPEDEVCNGKDDDCNEVVDDGPDGLPLVQTFYEGPEETRGIGLCSDGLQTCLYGAWVFSLDQVLPRDETCNGEDDDCDGSADDGFSIGEPCSAGVGICLREGQNVCMPDGSVGCSAEPGVPQDETCNGLDDDCDGEVDEDLPEIGEPCQTAVGGCLLVGQQRCDPRAGGLVCVGRPEQPCLLLFDDFEDGEGSWTHEVVDPQHPAPDKWQLDPQLAHSGLWAWWSGPTQNVPGETRLMSPFIDLRSVDPENVRITLRFMHFHHFEACEGGVFPDGGIIEAAALGQPWEQLWPMAGHSGGIDPQVCAGNGLRGQPAFVGKIHEGGFMPVESDLSGYAGTLFRFGFHVGWDCQNCDTPIGWFIDDVAILLE